MTNPSFWCCGVLAPIAMATLAACNNGEVSQSPIAPAPGTVSGEQRFLARRQATFGNVKLANHEAPVKAPDTIFGNFEWTNATFEIPLGGIYEQTATCAKGDHVVSGGVLQVDKFKGNIYVISSSPVGAHDNGWKWLLTGTGSSGPIDVNLSILCYT